MKLTFFAKPPQDVYLAFSGGIDSCVLLHNLLKRKIKVTLLHIHHNTPWCVEGQGELSDAKFGEQYKIPMTWRIYFRPKNA